MKKLFILLLSSSAFSIQNTSALPVKIYQVSSEKAQHPLPGQTVFLEPGFAVSMNEGRVDVMWATVKENNNYMFTVQKTKDREHFENICTSMASGKSSSIINYKETDYAPYPGLSYYRLMITDRDGHSEYTELISLVNIIDKKMKNSSSPVTCYDNAKYPSDINEFTLLLLRDKKGREFYSKFVVVEHEGKMQAFDVERKVTAGNYDIIASSNDKLYGKTITIK